MPAAPIALNPFAQNVGPTMLHAKCDVDLNGNAAASVLLEWADLDAGESLTVPPTATPGPRVEQYKRRLALNPYQKIQRVGVPLYFLTPAHRIQWRMRVRTVSGWHTTPVVTTTLRAAQPLVKLKSVAPNGALRIDEHGAIMRFTLQHGGERHWARFEYGTDPTFANSTKEWIISGDSHNTPIPSTPQTPGGTIPAMHWGGYPRGLPADTDIHWRFVFWNLTEGQGEITGKFRTHKAGTWAPSWQASVDTQQPCGEVWTAIPSNPRNELSPAYDKLVPFKFGADLYVPGGLEDAYTVLVSPTSVRIPAWPGPGPAPMWLPAGVNPRFPLGIKYGDSWAVNDASGDRAIALGLSVARVAGIVRVDGSLGYRYREVDICSGTGTPNAKIEAWWPSKTIPGGFAPITAVRIQAMDSAQPFKWEGWVGGVSHGSWNGILVRDCVIEAPAPGRLYCVHVEAAGGNARYGRWAFNDCEFRVEPGSSQFQGYGVRSFVRIFAPSSFDMRNIRGDPCQEHGLAYVDSPNESTGGLSCAIDCATDGVVGPNITGHVGELASRNTQMQSVSRGDIVAAGVQLAGNPGYPPSRGTIYLKSPVGRCGDN